MRRVTCSTLPKLAHIASVPRHAARNRVLFKVLLSLGIAGAHHVHMHHLEFGRLRLRGADTPEAATLVS